jgi:hypothetical protein
MRDTLTVAEKLKEAGFCEVQAAALTRAIEAAATAKAEIVAARMRKDLAAIIQRPDQKFEHDVANIASDQNRRIATIVFSAIAILIAICGIIRHFK